MTWAEYELKNDEAGLEKDGINNTVTRINQRYAIIF